MLFACSLTFLGIISIFIYVMSLNHGIHTNAKELFEAKTYFEPGYPPEGSVEEIYHDTLMLLISPYIDDAIEDYYGQPFSHAPYHDKVLSIERPNGYRTFAFIIKLEVMPYYGAHNTVGVDHITISISAGQVYIQKFEHIEDLTIPPPKPKTP